MLSECSPSNLVVPALSNLFLELVLTSGYEDDKDLGHEFTYTGKDFSILFIIHKFQAE